MSLLTQTEVHLDGEKLTHFTSYHLAQDVGEHHVFTLRCRADTFDRHDGNLFENSRNLLGKSFFFRTSSIRNNAPADTLAFSGVITQLVKERSSVDHHEIVITAHSPTVMLEGGPHYASYADRSLAHIANDVLRDTDANLLLAKIAPSYTYSIPYSVQHQNNWDYLRRLAAQYGEWLYYDGSQLVFGIPPEEEELVLKHSHGLISYTISIRPLPNQETFFAADYKDADIHQTPGHDKVPGTSGLLSIAASAAKTLYPTEVGTWAKRAPHEVQGHELELQATAVATTKAQNSVQLQVRSSNPGAHPGQLVYIDAKGFNEGRFRITSVMHRGDFSGNYENSFEGISEQLDIYPLTNLDAYPRSETQVATVQETDDPEALGRVRVQFPWQQALDEVTPWIRVSSPHAGPDKGIYFIPEISEEVMIGFEAGNAEKPFVIGSLYNGNQAAGGVGKEKNSIKMIRSRSGHTLELDDTEGEEKFRIYDKEGSIIEFDPNEKTLTVQAVENLNLVGKNILLQAEESVAIHAGKDVEVAAEGDAVIEAKKDIVLLSKADVIIEATTDATLAGQNVAVAGQIGAELKGAQTKVQGDITTVQGATGKTDYT